MAESNMPRYAPSFSSGMPPGPGSPAATVGGVVASDAACRKCGYNLRGISTTSRCPECGTAVGVSLHGDLLRFSEPKWLDSLRLGLNLILAGILVVVGLMIGVIAMGFGSSSRGLIEAISPVVGLCAGLLMFGGAWLLTAPDPSGIGEDQYGTSRKIIRVTLLVGLGNNVLQLANNAIHPDEGLMMMFQLARGIAGIIGLVGQAAQLQYLSKLALRIPDLKLSRRARFLMWAIMVDFGIILVMGMITAIAAPRLGPAAGRREA